MTAEVILIRDEEQEKLFILYPIKSSNIKAVGYSPKWQILIIKFNNDAIYQYNEVPPEMYKDFMEADSKGKYFHKYIKPEYSSIKKEIEK
jgi:hypothetical protein